MTTLELAQQYGPALHRMVELLGAEGSRHSFGSAMEAALLELGLPPPPPAIEMGLLTSAFRIIAGGRVPGCPDA